MKCTWMAIKTLKSKVTLRTAWNRADHKFVQLHLFLLQTDSCLWYEIRTGSFPKLFLYIRHFVAPLHQREVEKCCFKIASVSPMLQRLLIMASGAYSSSMLKICAYWEHLGCQSLYTESNAVCIVILLNHWKLATHRDYCEYYMPAYSKISRSGSPSPLCSLECDRSSFCQPF